MNERETENVNRCVGGGITGQVTRAKLHSLVIEQCINNLIRKMRINIGEFSFSRNLEKQGIWIHS